jgi:ABC-type uncharacterized transport system permease subunit
VTLVLFILGALAYGAATFAYGAERTRDEGHAVAEEGLQKLGRLLLATAVLLHFLAIGAQCVEGDHPLKNIFLATSFGTLIAVAGYLPLSRKGRLDALGPVMAPLGLVGLTLGVVFSGLGEGEVPGVQGLASAHVGFASAGLAGFTLAAGVASLYLVAEQRLRNKKFRPGRKGMSLAGLDRLHHRLVLLVTPVFTLAIVTGVLWILEAGGPARLQGRVFEIAAAGIAWLASVSLLVARAAWGTRGRRSAALTLLAFLAIVLIVVWYGVRT